MKHNFREIEPKWQKAWEDAHVFEAKLNRSKPKFFGFLSCEEAALAQKLLENRNANFCLFGGYEGAQRVMLGCLPDWCNETPFPISSVTFTYRGADELRHRDFLGALMALGITRESVGDILVEKGRTVVFFKDEVLPFVLSNVTKIGRVGVNTAIGFDEPLPLGDSLITASVTVSSLTALYLQLLMFHAQKPTSLLKQDLFR